jgi:hypothetical protein
MKKAGVSEFGRAFALAAAVAFAANAGITANWTPTASGTYSLVAADNWDGGVVPTNAADVANFAPGEIAGQQYIDFPGISGFNTWHLGVVTGASNQTIRLPARHSNGSATRYVYVEDPNGFQGAWATKDAWSRLYLTPTNGVQSKPTLATLDTANGPYLFVRGGTGVVDRITGGGMLLKYGASELQVKGIDPVRSARTSVVLGDFNSSITLAPAFSNALPAVEGTVALHFDASRADTLDVVEENGTNYVTAWRDADGRNITATPFNGNDGNGRLHDQRPWLSNLSVVNGVPLVDFGAYYGSGEAYAAALGPSASMSFPRVSGVREIFVVWQDTQSADSTAFVLGANDNYMLHRGNSGFLLNGSYYYEYHSGDETYIDGVKRSWTYGTYDFTRTTVASMNISKDDLSVNTLAQDRYIRFGGCRIAEVILYSTPLTSAERLAVHRHLQAKWQTLGSIDLREVRVSARDQPVGVEDGKTVDVGTLNISASTKFIKQGGGTLNIGVLTADGVSMDVRGGAVSFVDNVDGVTDTAPAAGAALWLDATKDDSFVRTNLESGVAGRDYIHRWNDCRPSQTAIYAYPMTSAVDTNRPFVVANAANGNAVVDFGTGYIQGSHGWTNNPAHDGSDAARLRISKNVNTYDGFIVLRMKNPTSYYNYYSSEDNLNRNNLTAAPPPLFGTSEQAFTRWGTTLNLAGFAHEAALAGYWTIDGVSFLPYNDSRDLGNTDFKVIAFSSIDPLNVNRMVDDRSITMGGEQIGEMILYTRMLSESERRSTEAYLMKKWLGKASPSMREALTFGTIDYAEGATPTITSDRAVTVNTVNMPAGAVLGQAGEGSLTLNQPISGAGGYSADGGVLTVRGNPFDAAFYHFDATDAESIVPHSVVENGDGTSTTNVAEWLDVRRNGMSARSSISANSHTQPRFITKETCDGKVMPVLDFGPQNDSTLAAGMNICMGGTALRSLDVAQSLVKELHVVYCDYETGKYGFIFSDNAHYPFHRGDDSGQMFVQYNDPTYGSFVSGGTAAVDGTARSYSYKLTDRKFHVISSMPSSGVPARTIAFDRTSRAGGSYQGELVAFKEHLDAAARLYVSRYLMWKWLGEGEEPVYTNAVGSISVAHGGEVVFVGGALVSVPVVNVEGEGTVTAGTLQDVASLSFDFPDESDYDRLVVNGDLVFAANGTISLNIGQGASVPGEYPILTASSFAGGNPLSWTRVVVNESNLCAALFIQDDTLYLRLTSKGTLMLFK